MMIYIFTILKQVNLLVSALHNMNNIIDTLQCILAPILILVGIIITIGFSGDVEGNVLTWLMAGVCPLVSGVLTLLKLLFNKE